MVRVWAACPPSVCMCHQPPRCPIRTKCTCMSRTRFLADCELFLGRDTLSSPSFQVPGLSGIKLLTCLIRPISICPMLELSSCNPICLLPLGPVIDGRKEVCIQPKGHWRKCGRKKAVMLEGYSGEHNGRYWALIEER